jgi:EAL domain-containing protein (putative c-di-GMP-specific phosphodiesterase class I)
MNICSNQTSAMDKSWKNSPIDEQSKMLCHVLVRATHDLHVNQHKSRDEIQLFLNDDCRQLNDGQVVLKVSDASDKKDTSIVRSFGRHF